MRDWLAQRARATPTATALVVPGERRLTYADLDDDVEELAGRLSALDVGVGDHLGVCLPTRPAFLRLVHAAMRVGARLVPLSDRLTAPELAVQCDRADVDLLVCDASTEAAAVEATGSGGVAGPGGSTGSGGSTETRDVGGALAGTAPVTVDGATAGARPLADVEPETYDLPAWNCETPQALLATSGTTGDPKIVTLTTGNLLASASASSWRLGVLPDDRWYVPLPIYHMGGLAPVYRSVLYGTAAVVSDSTGFDPERALAEMNGAAATCVSMVPAMLRDVLDAAEAGGPAVPDSLRFLLLGGAAAPERLVERALDRGVPVCPTYGATEAASQIATAAPGEAATAPGAVGRPLGFTDVTIVGPDGSECERGETGEIVVSGPTLTPGYYDDPEATEAAVSGRGFHTGDAGYRDGEGRLWVRDRLDDRIVTAGENVDPGEVAAVLRAHEAVADAAVVGLPDEEYGERVAALVVEADDEDANAAADWDAIEADLRDRLAGFKIPRTVDFAAELPRTASGTVDRAAVRERLRDAAADR